MTNEICGLTARRTILTGNYSYHGGEAQARIYAPGHNSNDAEANHLIGRDKHKILEWPPGYVRFNAALARAIPVCHFWAVVTMTVTGFCQLRNQHWVYAADW